MNEVTELPATTGAPQSLVGQLVKAEIDQQIATAHAYPRSITKVNRNILSLVTLSEAAAQECGYALPRGNKPVLGPSIRLAEIVASQWGNCRIGARVVHVDRFEKYVEAEGVFHDLESNTATTARVRRRIVDSRGNLYNDDMIVVTGNAAASIAKRNAILAGVPKAIWQPAYDAALRLMKGDVKTLPERRGEAFKQFAAFGVKPELIFAALGVGGEADIGLDELATLGAMMKAIKDGEEKVETYFPALGKAGADAKPGNKDAAPKSTAAKMADVASKGKAAAPKDDQKPDQGHDPETGEVTQGAQERGENVAQASEGGDTPAKDEAPTDGAANGASGEGGEDPAAAAYTRGRKAFARGMKSDACPPDLRKNEALAEAWGNGWKDARDEAEG